LYIIKQNPLNTLINKKLPKLENKQEAAMKTQRDYFVLLAGVVLGVFLLIGRSGAQVWYSGWQGIARQFNRTSTCVQISTDSDGNACVAGVNNSAYTTVKYNSGGKRNGRLFTMGREIGGMRREICVLTVSVTSM